MLTIAVQKREKATKLDALRAEGMVPAVVYGPKHEPVSIAVSAKEFQKIWSEAGYSSVVTLTGLNSPLETLIYDIALHPTSHTPMHVDFYAIEKGRKMEVSVPVMFVGTSPAEKLGAAILKVLHEIEVRAEAHNIPHDVTVDLADLAEVNHHITAGDIKLPAGVELVTDAAEIVVSATEANVDESSAAASSAEPAKAASK